MPRTTTKKLSGIATGLMLAAAAAGWTGVVSAQECFLGEVRYFAGDYAPRHWALANGQLLPISRYSALFSILGTTYGGDGRTTFGLPDLRGRSALGAGAGPGLGDISLGAKGGAETVTLDVPHMPSHTHSASTSVSASATVNAHGAAGDSAAPAGNLWANSDRNDSYHTGAPDVTMRAGAVGVSASATTTIGDAGGSNAFGVRSPYQALTPIICMQGFYPSRN